MGEALVEAYGLMTREMDLLRRERDFYERQLQWIRDQDETGVRSNGRTTNFSICLIGEMIGDFNGTDNSFWKWKQQLLLLKNFYQLDDGLFISSKLKKRAQSWFHSRPEHVILRTDDS